MLAQMERDDGGAVVRDERASLADDHALPPGTRDEIVRLDHRENVAVVHDGPGQIVEPATQVVALNRADPRGLASEEMCEEIEVVDRVRLRHPDVDPRPFEPGESPGGVADPADESGPQGLAQGRRHGMEAKDVTDLQEAPGGARGCFQRARLLHRAGERLLDEAGEPASQALACDRVMTVRRCDDVYRVDVCERRAVVCDRVVRLHAPTDRPREARRRHVRHPEGDPELGEDAQVAFAPAAEADQQDVHRPSSPPASRGCNPPRGAREQRGPTIRKGMKLGSAGATQPGVDRTALTAVSWSSSSQNPAIHVGSGGSAFAATTSPNETIAATRRTSARAIWQDSSMFDRSPREISSGSGTSPRGFSPRRRRA